MGRDANVSVLWERFERLVKVERTLPDGRIEGTSLVGWQAVLDLIRGRQWTTELQHDDPGSGNVLPRDAAELFPGGDLLVSLGVWPDPAVRLHFFPYEMSCIDFDFDTVEIHGMREFEILLDAMGRLARAASREVLLSHEGASEAVFMTVSADGAAVWSGPE